MALTALINLITANATQQGSADRITGAEMRAILTEIVNTIEGDVSFSAAIPFNKLVSNMAAYSGASPVTFTANASGAVSGFGTVLKYTANGGSNTPNLSAFKKTSISGNFVETNGTVNVIMFVRIGADYWYTVFQEAGTSTGNTTPAAPTLTADDSANTLSASHTLGTSEIVVSENGGAYVAYSGTINVGDVARAAGYWKFKIKAATGRNESAVVDSPAFTVAGNITPAAPTGGAVDDAANTFTFTLNPSYAASEHEYNLNGAGYVACSSNVINVGNVAVAIGGLLVRVKAATGRNASATLSNTTAFTVTAGSLIVEDTFNAGDTADLAGRSTPTGAKVWERYSSSTGYIGIGDNMAKMFTTGGNGEYRLPVGVRNVDMRVTMQGIDGGAWFLMLCFADDNNVIKVGVKTGEVYQYLAGDYGGAPMFAGSGVSAPGDVIRAVLNGTNLTIYRNATKLWDAAENGKSINAALSSTDHGMQSYTDTTSFMDNLQFFTV